MEKMIPANKDPEILIKETDQDFVHVKLTKKTVIPRRETDPSVDYEVKCYIPEVFEKMEALRYTKQHIVWYRAGGFTEAIVVHDPKLRERQKAEADKKIEADLKEKNEATKEARAKRDQTRRIQRKRKVAAKGKGQGTA